MLRNWATQFGYGAGSRAGDEQISELDRAKFIDQIGTYLGWNPPPGENWVVEVTKDDAGKYVFALYRHATETEAARMLGTGYENARLHVRGCPACAHIEALEKASQTEASSDTPEESCSTCGVSSTE